MKEKMKSKHAPRKRTDNTRRDRNVRRNEKHINLIEEEDDVDREQA